MRLPLVLLPAGMCSYLPEVVLRYADAMKPQKAGHETAVADAKSKVEKDEREYKAQLLKEKAPNRFLPG